MIENKRYCLVSLISILLLHFILCQALENSRLKDVLRNSTSSGIRNHTVGQRHENSEENILRDESKKVLKECGGNSNDFENSNTNSRDSRGRKQNNNYENSQKNNRMNNTDRKNYQYDETDNDSFNDDDGDWNINSSNHNRNKNSVGLNQRGNRYGNNGQMGYTNNNENQWRQSQQNSNHYRNRNNSFGFNDKYGDSSNSYLNSQSGYGNPNEYNQRGRGGNSNSQNGYGNTNEYNQNDRGGQNLDNRNSHNYEQDSNGNSNREGMNRNWGSQNVYGGNRPKNMGVGTQQSNSDHGNRPSSSSGYGNGYNQNTDCDENGDRSYYRGNSNGYMNGGVFGLITGQQASRPKRNSDFKKNGNDENDDQCISQCVFGYLQLLDDDRTPSESMVIKWLQEHVTGNDMDRIKALRDARKCFARINTIETEDGCELSKEIASCLELNLE